MAHSPAMRRSTLFLLFLFANTLGAFLNHIDDTDETYGYWEPLHYLLFGNGMQTWEYAPQFAIRSYAFLMPLYVPLSFLKAYIPDKIQMFFLARMLLGTFSAYAESRFIWSIYSQKQRFPALLAKITCFLMLFSSGMLFCSTSFLPSAVCSALLMLSIANWLENRFYRCIAWGAVAVLWTGWPFVGLAFLPLGLHMLREVFLRHYQHATPPVTPAAEESAKSRTGDAPAAEETAEGTGSFLSAVGHVVLFAVTSLVVVAAVGAPALLVDKEFYNAWTVPGLNILVYNALAGSGDELYGVEPPAYYVKNLFLNCNVSWVLFLASPVSLVYMGVVFLRCREQISSPMQRGFHTLKNFSTVLTLYALVLVWLGTLFLRPHKEERFLYPVYGPLALLAAHTLLVLLNVLDAVCELLDPRAVLVKKSTVRVLSLCAVVALAALLTASRVAASHINYYGYLDLFAAHSHLIVQQKRLPGRPTALCIGAEWHRFPSHFLLNDDRVRLHFVRDRFGGILPQPFGNHTHDVPVLAVNDRNREEMDRYVPLAQCDYLLATVEVPERRPDDLVGRAVCTRSLSALFAHAQHGNVFKSMLHHGRGHCSRDDGTSGGGAFAVAAFAPVLSYDPSKAVTGNTLLTRALVAAMRAFYLPLLSNKHVPRAAFALFKHLRE